jgi:release factor glutamine methyltransferase
LSVTSFPPESVVVDALRSAGCVFAEDEAQLLLATASTPSELAGLLDRRVAGEPLEHVLGWAEFHGLRIAVEPGVFVPRRRTEYLVDEAAALTRPGAVVVDLCCGSGALGVALAAARPGIELYAADIEPVAVRCARGNVVPAGGQVFEGDLYDALPAALRGRIDILLANVPYVPTGAIATMPPEARDHEPRVTLDGGDDGLAVLRRVSAAAAGWLAPGGHLLVESSTRQAPDAAATFRQDGLDARIATFPDREATVVIGTNTPPTGPASAF